MKNDETYNMTASIEIIFTINIILSIALGYMLGREREIRHKDAGIGTNTFVIMGAMMFTFLSARVDPLSTSRIAAGMITGIGFLGAGIIIQKGNSVKNLTTAASIWFASGIGMAIGYQFYYLAIIAGFAGVLIPHLPHIKKRELELIKKEKEEIAAEFNKNTKKRNKKQISKK